MINNLRSRIEEEIKKDSEILVTTQYDLRQSAFRYLYKYYRLKNEKYFLKKKKIIFFLDAYISSISFFLKLKVKKFILKYFFCSVFLKKKNFDILIYVNTEYKLNSFKEIFNKSNLKIAIFYENFNIKNKCNKFYYINKYFFLNKDLSFNKKKYYKYETLFNKYSVFEKVLKFNKPKKIIFMEGDDVSTSILSQVAIKMNIKTYCLQHGFFEPILGNFGEKFKYDGYFKEYVYLAQSELTVNFLKKKNLIDKYFLVGSPFISKRKKVSTVKKKIVVFATPIANSERINNNFIEDISEIINNISTKNSRVEIIVRYHPSVSIRNKETNDILKSKIIINNNISFQNPNSIDLDESLKNATIVLTILESSTIFDSLIKSVIPIIFTLNDFYKNNFILKNKVGYISNNKNKIIEEIQNILVNNKTMNEYKNNIRKISNNICRYYKKDSINLIKKIMV
jgi:UDP-N-acetylglucosamine 2-epimerase